MNERFESAPIGILQTRADGVVTAINDRAGSLLDIDPEAAVHNRIEEIFPASVENSVQEVFGNNTPGSGQYEEYYPEIDRWFNVTITTDTEGSTVYLQDVTQRHRDRRRIETLEGDLERLTITNELISDILTELVEASSREEIAETICDGLGETDLYEFAWVGERELGGDDILVQATAGTTGRTLSEIEGCLEAGPSLPEQQAIETGLPVVVQPLGEDESVPEPIRRTAFADGLQSLLAIPLVYGSNVYGVVGIYSANQDAFSARERDSFLTVGEMAGFAINASRQRNLLLSDRVVELRIELTDSAAPFVGATAKVDSRLVLDGIVPQGGELYCYLTVSQSPPESISSVLDSFEGVEEVRTIGEYESGGSLEITLDEETPLGVLAGQGVTIKHAEYEAGRGEYLVELSPETDVRRVAESVTREFDGEVVSKRQHERELTTPREFREALRDDLTEKQENALRTAFFANYFESPRGSTAEEVASTLGITGPTLLHHLRAGQRKLLSEVFDTPEESKR